MRILLIPFSGGLGLGPLTRCLAIAEEGKKRGHKVAFLCKPFFKKITETRGFLSYLSPEPKHIRRNLPKYRLADLALEYGLLNLEYLQKAIKQELAIIKTFRPNIIFTETQFSINFSSKISGIPWSTAISWTDHAKFRSSLYKTFSIYPHHLDQINRLASQYNISPYGDLCDLAFERAHIKIAPTSPELQPELLSFPNVHFVGSLLSETLENQGNNIELPINIYWPSIYVYMSPGEIPARQWIHTICNAFSKQSYNVIVMLSPLKNIPRHLPNFPNIHFLGLAPARKFIRLSDVVITHGGGNTMVNALLNNKPLLIFPHNYAERHYNGCAIERLGAGFNLPTKAFTPEIIRKYVEILIHKESFIKNAKKLGKHLWELGGTKRAVDILESYCKHL